MPICCHLWVELVGGGAHLDWWWRMVVEEEWSGRHGDFSTGTAVKITFGTIGVSEHPPFEIAPQNQNRCEGTKAKLVCLSLSFKR